jgi:Fe-Mn family superoxide dismutase
MSMAITLPPLPYSSGALAPHISKRTLDFHYGKHHRGYVEKVNKLIAGKPEADATLEDLILDTAGDGAKSELFNNAAQVWNHTFFWRSMKPRGGGKPKGDIAKAIDRDFGGLDGFKEAFSQAAAAQFGSGWAWLIVKSGKLAVTKTPNAELPMEKGVAPLLTIDVWEHAYYLDYQNARAAYIKNFVDKLIDWEFADANLAKA